MRLIGNRQKEHDQYSQGEPVPAQRTIQHKPQSQKPLQRNYGSGTMNGQQRDERYRSTAKPHVS
jgi:hypothetical protein